MWVHSFPPPVLCCLSHPPDAILPNATPACLPAQPHWGLHRNRISCTVKASKTAMDAGNTCPPLTLSCCHPAPTAWRHNNTDRWGHTTLLPHLRWMSYLVLTSTFLLLAFFLLTSCHCSLPHSCHPPLQPIWSSVAAATAPSQFQVIAEIDFSRNLTKSRESKPRLFWAARSTMSRSSRYFTSCFNFF